jgi:hypothetical protein
MSRIIINNNADIPDRVALDFAITVIHMGKISETNKVDHYCHATTIGDFTVWSTVTKSGTYSFTIDERQNR